MNGLLFKQSNISQILLNDRLESLFMALSVLDKSELLTQENFDEIITHLNPMEKAKKIVRKYLCDTRAIDGGDAVEQYAFFKSMQENELSATQSKFFPRHRYLSNFNSIVETLDKIDILNC